MRRAASMDEQIAIQVTIYYYCHCCFYYGGGSVDLLRGPAID